MKRKRAQNGRPRSVKLSLNSVLRDQYRANFVAQVTNWCHTATVITVLASLLFLFENNRAFDEDNHDFFRGNGYELIKDCFNNILNENRHKLPLAFRQIIEAAVPNFRWPQREGMGNAFNQLIDQYTTNVKNNIKTWCYTRIKTFFVLQRYELNLLGHNISDIDVKNATKSVMFNNIVPSANVVRLLEQARMIGIPVGTKLCDLVRGSWFQTIPIFITIQRLVFNHHERYELLNDLWRRYYRDRLHNAMPSIARPPKIKNFRVIPIHDFKMKHIRIDIHLFYQMACKLGAIKLAKGLFGQPVNISKKVYDSNPFVSWDTIFNMDKIQKVGNRKTFDYTIVTDSVAVSLCFLKPECPSHEYSHEQINDMYENGVFRFVLGMDPGVRTWNATVRKHIASGVEENITIDGPKYHFRAKYGKRKRKSEKWLRLFTELEQHDRNQYPFYPSPKGASNWMSYIEHRVKMLQPGMEVYTARKYIRLNLDKHIEETRASDTIAAFLTRKLPSLIFLGAAQMAPNSPIGIKKRLRCPGVRKLLNSFKKLHNCVVVMVDEYKTSQTCAKCFRPFDRRTKKDRYKVCRQCIPHAANITTDKHLSSVIISKKSNRSYQRERRHVVAEYERLNVHPVYSHGLVPKHNVWFKNWQLNTDNTWNDSRHPHQQNTVWHRDEVAAKCILYKGLCMIKGLDVHPQLSRQHHAAAAAAQNNAEGDQDDNDSDSDDDYVYVLDDVSDEE
ncbi:uncharacterized protein LOC129568699 [Sitodiplosis mosellana]|uniref:uncharacterized protein LOC129568699 n=1 Tax=Sitodiplosis mosellana TaxID=263140 RepID=UPI0024445817|nr:uncharacterized protein LOC129568699 [Sitodiplosis mosellana]